MYKRLSAVMFPVLALVLVGSLYWGYQEHQEKNRVLIKAENQYQRAFHDLSTHIDRLNQQLGNTLAVHSNSQQFHRKGLVNAWRLTSAAQNQISQLPLGLLPFSKADDFLSRIANFSYKTATRDLAAQPLSEEEWTTLRTLYDKSAEIAKDLSGLQQEVMKSELRWMDVELLLSSKQETNQALDHMIIRDFKSVEDKVGEYPEIAWGPSVTQMYAQRTLTMLSENPTTEEDVLASAAKFLNKDASQLKIELQGEKSDYATYVVSSTEDSSEAGGVRLEFSQHGGKLLTMSNGRELGEKKLERSEAQERATAFLKEHEFGTLAPVSHDDFERSSVFTFVARQNGILLYPEKVLVKVAMDNGEIIGLQASEYAHEHHDRDIQPPELTFEKARSLLNPAMEVDNERLALILNDSGEEILCFEFTGEINSSRYRIYLNAATGQEETVEKMPVS